MSSSGVGPVCTLCAPRRLDRAAEIFLVEQVHVRPQRERRRMMAEPLLDLHRVPTGGEHARSDRVPERVESGPLDARLGARRPEHARCRCAGRTVARSDSRTRARRPLCPRHGAVAGPRARAGSAGPGARAATSAARSPAPALLPARALPHLDVRPVAVERQVPDLEREQFGAPHARSRRAARYISRCRVMHELDDDQLHRSRPGTASAAPRPPRSAAGAVAPRRRRVLPDQTLRASPSPGTP